MPLLKDTLNATLWSVLAEIIAKIISPAVFLILTHILSPSDFGVVSVATTILGLIYVVSDMGTSKVLIQAEDDEGNIQNYMMLLLSKYICWHYIIFGGFSFFKRTRIILFSASIRLCDKSHVCTNIVVLIVFCSKCH